MRSSFVPRIATSLVVLALVCARVSWADGASHHPSEAVDFDVWPDCDVLPPAEDRAPLPIFLPTETPSFVDLGSLTKRHAGEDWKALQWTRDKNFGTVPVQVGKWIRGAAGDDWPPNTVDVRKEMRATRLVAWEIDGELIRVKPSCFLDLSSDEGAFGLYNFWVRFNAPGTHTLRIFLRQKRDFYFVYHGNLGPIADPGDGRWVFLKGEVVGKRLDGLLTHRYTLDVQP